MAKTNKRKALGRGLSVLLNDDNKKINIGNTIINNDDYVMADIDGIVIIPKNEAEEILLKSEKLIATESEIRKAIRDGMDPKEAYIKFSVF